MKTITEKSNQLAGLEQKSPMKLFLILFVNCLILLPAFTYSQGVAINTTGTEADPSSMLDVSSTDKGVLISRMSTAQRNAIVSPAQGLLIYNTTTQCFEFYENSNWNTMGCTCTVPDIPVAIAGSGATATQITANWNAATGATSYSLDVSTVSDFSSFVAGYNDLNVGVVTTYDVTGLDCNTTYYYRVRAVNACGITGSSNSITVSTSACGPSCGTQIWMSANMDVGTMVDGTIPLTQQTNDGVVEKFCYNNIPANCITYGGLYEWSEAMQISYTYNTSDYPTDYTCDPCGSSGRQGICPSGFHIPTDLEWSRYEWCVETTIAPTGSTPLVTFQTTFNGYRGSLVAGVGPGDKMRAGAPDWDGTNTSGFTALHGGYRYGLLGTFNNLTSYAAFWSATEINATDASNRFINSGYPAIYRNGNRTKNYGYSIRCLQN